MIGWNKNRNINNITDLIFIKLTKSEGTYSWHVNDKNAPKNYYILSDSIKPINLLTKKEAIKQIEMFVKMLQLESFL